ncbi:cholesteryl ester transfer protein isoform X3 [Fukomys damarensis]|uniref:cholesteryl ester transfer protein isoform X3 n=1 Tax=Fukomys damarensis TaxID=885580 RepID=UPI001455661E|nr:cholesteryl ester transfer protein isoform X3 [Fukomys damarensis]
MLAAALLSLALLDSVHACSTSPPSAVGIVCRITKPAFLVLNQETAKVIQTAFQRASYPDIKGEKAVVLLGHIKYGLHNIQISHLTIASSQVELAEAKSIDISIQNVSVIFKGTLNYGYMSAWGLSINQSVGFEIDSAIDLQINTQLICDSGRVRTDALDCHLSFHKLLLNLHGEHEPGWIKRLFTNFISFTLQLVLKGQVCKEISVISNGMADFVQSRAASILSDGDIGVDISLTGLPIITATYLESHHKGCFIYKNVSEDLILPAFSPSLLGDSRMLYFWFSEQVLDSLAKAAFQDGRLTLNLTGDKFKDIITTIQASYSQKKLFLSLLDFQITPKTASNESEVGSLGRNKTCWASCLKKGEGLKGNQAMGPKEIKSDGPSMSLVTLLPTMSVRRALVSQKWGHSGMTGGAEEYWPPFLSLDLCEWHKNPSPP